MKTISHLLTRLTDYLCGLTLHSFYSPLRFHHYRKATFSKPRA